MFRNKLNNIPSWFSKAKNGDYTLQLLLTSDGSLVHYNNKIMSVYRHHAGGVSNIFKKKNVYNYSMIFINQSFNKYTKGKYKDNCLKNTRKHSIQILKHKPVLSYEFWRLSFLLFMLEKKVDKVLFNLLKKRIFKKRILLRLKLPNKQ